ncbi:MAG TPA: thioesterase domain-containing protein, partial [Tepidisphaeraceae bacterium]|nr:thioesterase domain-containing protein [Tepidisphaeraceae bacterium]
RGQMEWAQPVTEESTPRVGRVYLMRGWVGVFSSGIDQMGETLRSHGVTAHVYQHDQAEELARTIAANYRNVPDPEPIVIIGHSYGSDDAIKIARACDQAGVPVEMIVALDCVDESVIPKNVKTAFNFWTPGALGGNFLRGLPMTQEAGAKGVLHNVAMRDPANAHLCDGRPDHVNLDKGPKLQAEIVKQVLAVCPERNTWLATRPLARARVAAAKLAPVLLPKASMMPAPAVATRAKSAAGGPSADAAKLTDRARQSSSSTLPVDGN